MAAKTRPMKRAGRVLKGHSKKRNGRSIFAIPRPSRRNGLLAPFAVRRKIRFFSTGACSLRWRTVKSLPLDCFFFAFSATLYLLLNFFHHYSSVFCPNKKPTVCCRPMCQVYDKSYGMAITEDRCQLVGFISATRPSKISPAAVTSKCISTCSPLRTEGNQYL